MLKNLLTAFCFVMIALFFTGSTLALAQKPPVLDSSGSGLASIPISPSGTTWKLGVKLVTEPRCFFGDRDAIGLELVRSSSPTTKLLLSVETLPGSSNPLPPVTADITSAAKQLDKGYDVAFTVPRSMGNLALGIFICKDSNNEGRCNTKEIKPLPAVLNQYDAASGALTPEFVATDKSYFFKPLFLVDNSLYYPAVPFSDKRYKQLEQFIYGKFGLSAESKNAFTQISTFGSTLQSRPLQVVDNKLVIRIPGYAPSRCRGVGGVAPERK